MVDVADRWKERLRSYPGRSHGRVETEYEAWSKACHEKSAEAIIPMKLLKDSFAVMNAGEGPNFRR